MKKYLICFAITSLAFFSCKKDEIQIYNQNEKIPTIYFQRLNSVDYNNNMTIITKRYFTDSIGVSFSGLDPSVKSLSALLPINLIGNSVTEPLKVILRVNEKLTTAIEGIDYTANFDTCYIYPGNSITKFYLTLLRTESLRNKKVQLAIDIVDSETYEVMNEYNNTDIWNNYRSVLSGRTYRITFDEAIQMPSYWRMFGVDYFGEWTIEKYLELNEVMGWTISDWSGVNQKVLLGILPYAGYTFQQHLQKLSDANNPKREADGSFMQLASKYSVDYSRHEKSDK